MHISALIKQKSYEHIVYVLRRHPITFLPILILFIVLALMPIAVYLMINALYPTLFDGEVVYSISVLLASVYYLTIFLFFYARFVDYYLDMWIVTNDRIMDVEQLNLFSRTISELDLFRIQDVTTDVHGFFPTVFKYGNISVKTASQNINIVFQQVSNPNKIREELIHLSHEDRKYHYTSPADSNNS